MTTSWETSHRWYDSIVGEKGHYYHEHVILPKTLKLLDLKKGDSVLDLGCGQGVLSRHLPKDVDYVGVDASLSLIQKAEKLSPQRAFHVYDITKKIQLKHPPFSHATLILVLQNVQDFEKVFENAAQFLKQGGKLLIVLNHPCYRVPRQSSWGIDQEKKLQYRRIDVYMTPLEIPIHTHPGAQAESPVTFSFHQPISAYASGLKKAGFMIETIEEWISDKKSTGPKARMENRSRLEFPLFLAILAVKL